MPQVVPALIVKIGVALEMIGTAVTLGAATGVTAIVAGTAAVIGGARLVTANAMPDLTTAIGDNASNRQATVRSTTEPQKLIYGQALVSGPITFVGVAGTDNRDLYHQIALAGHEIHSITDIYFDDQVITNSSIGGGAATGGNVTTGDFGPLASTTICKINKHLGTSTQAADSDLVSAFTEYTSSHQGKGVANIVTKWTLTDESQSVWDKKKPNNIKALVKGKKDIYDPRLDTSAGANPTDSSYQAWTDNPALCIADYLMSSTFGLGIAAAKIDWDAVVTAANACDVSVSIPGSTTEKRFTCNGVIFGTDQHRQNIDKILSAMNGNLTYTSGKYTIRAGVYAAPSESLDEDDLAGAVIVKTSVERSQRFNKITGMYISPADNHKSVEFPAVQLTAALQRDNNETLERNISLPMTNTSYMAQRIANKLVQLSDQQKVITFPCNLSGLRVAVGDRVSITLSDLGYSNKVFRCVGWSFSESNASGVNLTLIEDDSGSYADPDVSAYSTISATGVITAGFPGVPDPSNLTATAGLKNIELNWTNPTETSLFTEIVIYASPDSSWSNKVEIGRTRGTQFIHDASNAADAISPGDTRFYWIRALAYGAGSGAGVESDRQPDNDTSTISATAGANDPNYTDVVNNVPAQEAPSGLTLTETTVLGNDGSVLPAIRVSWTAPTANTYVSHYDVEFKRTSQGEIDYGQVTDSYTATIDYGSVATATTVELNYGGVNEAISGAGTAFSSVNVHGVSTVISGMQELEEFTVRVKAVTVVGTTSGTITGTITLQGDQTAPGIPGSITATGGIQQIKLNWDNPSDSDLAYVEIYENDTDNRATSSLIVQTRADQHTVSGLGNAVTKYYWLRSADRSGNVSGFSASVNATTQKVAMNDLAQDVLDEFSAGDAFGIEPVGTLSGVTGSHVGQIKFLTTTNTLYVWTGSAWSTDLFTASEVDPGSITAASFASGVEPISAVTSLPSPSGYTGPNIVFLTTDKKLYRYDSSVPEFTTLINASDLTGTFDSDQFPNSLRPVEVLGALPTTGNTQGRTVLLTTDNKLYRYTGTSFTTAISAADLSDQLNVATQVVGELPVSNANAGLRNSGITINADGSLSGAGAGNVTLSGIGAGALAAQNTVNLATQVAGELSAAYAAAGLKNSNVTINADGTLGGAGAGQVSLSGIGAGALASLNSITATEITDGSITTPKIAAGQITAAKLNASEVFADSVVASNIAANSVTAANIKSVLVSTDKLVADQIAANTITADLIASRTILAGNIVADTLTGNEISANSVNADRLVANSITAGKIAAGTITATEISTGTLTANKLNVSEIFGDSAVIGAIQASSITTAAVVAAIGTFEFIQSDNIQSNAITAGKLAASDVVTSSAQISDGIITNAKIGNTIQSSNYSAGSAGWIINKNGDAEFNGVVLSRNLIVASGTYYPSDQTTTFSGDIDTLATFFVEGVYSAGFTAWGGSNSTLLCNVEMGGSFYTNVGYQTTAMLGPVATILPLTKFQGTQGFTLKIEMVGRHVAGWGSPSDLTLSWKIYKVT